MSIVILLFGSMLGIGIYAGPMLAGLFLLPIGRELGRRDQAMIWLAVSLLGFMLISDMEQNLMYLCLFGCYPILRPWFQKLQKPVRLIAKLAYFNVVIIAAEAIVLLFFAPEAMGAALIITLLVLGNVTFLCYDLAIPVFDVVMAKYLHQIFKR
ncbi:MAG: hypothetical protein PUD16_04800 [bacterium]|nr:hypothetical protein [bacterium]